MKLRIVAMLLATMVTMQMAFAEALTEEQAAEKIKIESIPLTIKSGRLNKRYSAYKVVMTTDYPGTLNVQSGGVSNAVTGQLAYQAARATAGYNWFWLFFPYLGIIIAPITAVVSHNKNKRAEEESLQYPGQVPFADALGRGETLEFQTLVPIGQKPSVRVVLHDKQEKLTFTKSVQ